MDQSTNLKGVLESIKDEFGVEIFKTPQFVSIFRDLAPNLKRDGRFLSMLVETNYIDSIIEIAEEDDESKREMEINRLELLIEDSELIVPSTSDSYIRTLIDVLVEQKPESSQERAPDNHDNDFILVGKPYSPYTRASRKSTAKKRVNRSAKSGRKSATRTASGAKKPVKTSTSFMIVALILFIALVLGLGASAAINFYSAEASNNEAITPSGQDLASYLGKNIDEVAAQFGEGVQVEPDSNGFTFRLKLGEKYSLAVTANSNRQIWHLMLDTSDQDQKYDYNVEGVNLGISRSDAKVILQSRGFSLESVAYGFDGVNKDLHVSVFVNDETKIVTTISISDYSITNDEIPSIETPSNE